ncbi:Bowman-Birk type proteinase inhibitor-like [Nymphaea colorata]|nr:Bowman-Birk type proteinase inhibitor-like [Nymphaea colorata]
MRGVSTVLVAFMAILLAVSVLGLDAAVEEPLLSIIAEDEAVDARWKPCCDSGCVCTRARIPDCHCLDIKDHCYPGCKGCICTKSIPPQCQCTDVLHFCPKPCSEKKL